MAFDIGVGGGQTATVNEPQRGAFDSNLGGALQFGAAHVVYKILEGMGGAIGAFAAGVLVEFMDRIEPSLVKYTAPLLDLLLDMDDLDPKLRAFLQPLRDPTDAGAAAVLGGIAGQAGGMMTGNFLAPLLQGVTQAAHRGTRNTMLGVSELFQARRRGEITDDQLQFGLASHGYTDQAMYWLAEISKPRPGVGDLVTARFRGGITLDEYHEQMTAYGFNIADSDLYLENARQLTDVGSAMTLYRRGELNQGQFFEKLALLGVDHEAMVDLDTLKELIPGPTDLVRMGLREAWDDQVAAQWGYDADFPEDFAVWMEKQGYSRDWSEKYWRAHWVLPSVTNGFEMFHRGIITEDQLKELLRISDIPAKWRENLVKVAYQPYTRVDVRRMHDMGILTDAELKTAYMDLGYDDEKAENMKLFTIAYNDKAGEGEMTEYKELTRSVIVSAYQKGIIAQDQAETRLLDIGYEMDGIGLILSLAAWQKDIDDIPDPMPEYRRDLKSMIEKAYSQRIISASEATDTLVGVGFTEIEVAYMLSAVDLWYGLDQSAEMLKTIGDAYITRGINRGDAIAGLGQFGLPSAMSEQKLAEWEVQRHIRSRRATEAQYRKALELEVIGIEEYKENLRGLGYTEYDIWMFTAMVIGVEAAGEPSETGPTTLLER